MSYQELLGIEVAQMERPCFFDDENTVFFCGISGGKDSSAALLFLIHVAKIPTHRIIAGFCDTANEHEWTYEHIRHMASTVHPIVTIQPERGFFDLAFYKHRFPSTKARFCTEELKIWPIQDYIQWLKLEGYNVISVSGTRADESEERKNKPEWDYSGTLLSHNWRPLIAWTVDDVLALHSLHGVPLNPLYAAGALRVGCFPCIMSRKSEIRMIALKFPERIDAIRKAERQFEETYGRYSSFFPRNVCPERFRTKEFLRDGKIVMEDGKPLLVATIDDVVRWAMTGERALGAWDDVPADTVAVCNSGFCE